MDKDLRILLGLLVGAEVNLLNLRIDLAARALEAGVVLVQELLAIDEEHFTTSYAERLVEEATQYLINRIKDSE